VLFYLNKVEEFWFAERSSGQRRGRVFSAVVRLKVERLLPTHPLAEDGSARLQLAVDRRGPDVSAALELVN
jgi:hypothetical protein